MEEILTKWSCLTYNRTLVQNYMKNIIKALSLIALCTIVGCAYSGREIDPNALSKIKKGKTTKAEVIALLGPPSQQMPMGYDGGVYMIYSNFKSNMANAMILYGSVKIRL